MIKEIDKHLEDLGNIKISSNDDLEKFRIKYISKKGIVTSMFSQLKNVPNEQKKEVGLKINSLKQRVFDIISLHAKLFPSN